MPSHLLHASHCNNSVELIEYFYEIFQAIDLKSIAFRKWRRGWDSNPSEITWFFDAAVFSPLSLPISGSGADFFLGSVSTGAKGAY